MHKATKLMLALLTTHACGFASMPHHEECPADKRLSKPSLKSTFPKPLDKGETPLPVVASWFKDNVASIPMKGPPQMSARQKELAKMSASEFMTARKTGSVTCVEYAGVLTMRAEHYKYMGQFMYWDNMPDQMDVVMAQAAALDAKAASEGIDSIAPLYCLPVPMKGTMATVDFPSSAGVGVLHDFKAIHDAGTPALVKAHGGIVFAKTNVPEFAASWVTCNYANGCTLNPYDHALTVGGSSGGSGSAVASYIAPVAFTEDTGGSTRHPSYQNHNFGYDPSRNHYPNHGNPGMSYTNDQVGINARSYSDILAFDAAFLGIQAEHDAAAAAAKSIGQIKVGTPKYPFVEMYTFEGCNNYGWPIYPSKLTVSEGIMAKYEASIAAMASAGATIIDQEWPDRNGRNAVADNMICDGAVNGANYDVFLETFHSFSGQVAEWVRNYLNKTVSVKDIVDDIYTAGAGHGPAGFLTIGSVTDESRFRYGIGPYYLDTIDVWNSYFDTWGVDVIFTPAQFCDAFTYEGMAGSTLSQRLDGMTTYDSSVSLCNFVAYCAYKNIPVPKVTVPVGTDASGKPVSVEFWGRSGPMGASDKMWAYDDEIGKTGDVGFLYTIKPLIEAIATDPALVRVDAALVKGMGNLFM